LFDPGTRVILREGMMNAGNFALIAGLAGLVSILLSAKSVREIIPIRSELIGWINAIPNEG
jgi:hypothetical protein